MHHKNTPVQPALIKGMFKGVPLQDFLIFRSFEMPFSMFSREQLHTWNILECIVTYIVYMSTFGVNYY